MVAPVPSINTFGNGNGKEFLASVARRDCHGI